MSTEEQEITPQSLEGFLEEIRQECEQVKTEIMEIDVLISQSTSEVDKLARRNVQLTNKLRQVEANIDTYPRHDIKDIYSAAQEAQMRLFMMRGQVEQLQNKRSTLEKYARQLQRFLSLSDQVAALASHQMSESLNLSDQQTIVRIIEAQEIERQHLARQMHDGPAQSLTNLSLQAEICERLFDTDPVQARAELNNLKRAVNATFQKTRDFIFNLRPMMLDDLGLVPTLKRYIQDCESKSGVSINLSIMGKEVRLPSHTEVTVFRVIQALISNVYEHAHATHVQVTLDLQPEAITATVEDDGSGFDVEEALASAAQRKALGLATMKERVEMLNGTMELESNIGHGTKVKLQIPVI